MAEVNICNQDLYTMILSMTSQKSSPSVAECVLSFSTRCSPEADYVMSCSLDTIFSSAREVMFSRSFVYLLV